MKVKPKEILVNLPAAHLFQSEDEMASFASAINTIIVGKVKVKYEFLGLLGGQSVGLFYIQRNNESQEIHDDFMQLIEAEEMQAHEVPISESCANCGHYRHYGRCTSNSDLCGCQVVS
jgi:hypothetical protein